MNLAVALTVRVDDREEKEVVLVDKALDLGAGRVLRDQRVCQVLNGLCEERLDSRLSSANTHRIRLTRTIPPIHSRAWTVPWMTMEGLTPLPELPNNWIPVMARPLRELPEVTMAELAGYDAWRSFKKVRWSAYEWYELNQVALALPANRRIQRSVQVSH